MPDDLAKIIGDFGNSHNRELSYTLETCRLCGDEHVDYLPTRQGFVCFECLLVCVDVIVRESLPRPTRWRSAPAGAEI